MNSEGRHVMRTHRRKVSGRNKAIGALVAAAVAGGGALLFTSTAQAASVGVDRLVQIGCDIGSARWTVGMLDAHPAVLGGVAIHPNEAPALEERGNVFLRRAEFIHVRGERQVDGDAVGRERLCDGRIDAELRANFGAV